MLYQIYNNDEGSKSTQSKDMIVSPIKILEPAPLLINRKAR